MRLWDLDSQESQLAVSEHWIHTSRMNNQYWSIEESFHFNYELGESTYIYDFFEKGLNVAEQILARHYWKEPYVKKFDFKSAWREPQFLKPRYVPDSHNGEKCPDILKHHKQKCEYLDPWGFRYEVEILSPKISIKCTKSKKVTELELNGDLVKEWIIEPEMKGWVTNIVQKYLTQLLPY